MFIYLNQKFHPQDIFSHHLKKFLIKENVNPHNVTAQEYYFGFIDFVVELRFQPMKNLKKIGFALLN